jgi:integrase
VKKKEVATHRPFTLEETHKILHAFKTNQFVHKCSRYNHSHYYPFVYFLFSTGVRNAEAVGLRVRHVDIINNKLQIERALARTLKGTHPKARIDKETKNGKVRYLPLSPELKEVLLPLLINKELADLVFTSVNGLCIDDRMFTRRVFKPVLKALNIEFRTLYACRHGFSSRLLAGGVNPVIAGFLLGNNPATTLTYYTHLISMPETLPAML